jgi:hypothetical protein
MWPSKAYTTKVWYIVYIYISQSGNNKQTELVHAKNQPNKFKETITAYTKHRYCAPGGQMPHPTSHLAELVKPQWRSHLISSRFLNWGVQFLKNGTKSWIPRSSKAPMTKYFLSLRESSTAGC